MTELDKKIDSIFNSNNHFEINGYRLDKQCVKYEIKQLIKDTCEEIIGEYDENDEMCEYCSDWDDGRNSLRDYQRSKFNELLGDK